METLGIRDMRWSGFVATSRLPELMQWAFENPSPEAFREFAAWTLPWREGPEATVRRFETAFPREESLDVAKALAQQAAVLDTATSRAALARFVQDTAADPVLRAVAATELVRTGTAEALRLLKEIAAHDADPAIREAARVAALAADPPGEGYLVTMIAEGDSWAEAGLRAGDIVTSFDGRAVAGPEPDDFLWKGISAAEEGKRTPKVEVLRGGEKVVLYLPAEFPVIVGLPVRRKE
jgi:PDZ domain-containing protein